MPGIEPDRPQEGELPTTLEHISKEDGTQPECTQDEPQATQGLEGGQIGVLNPVESRQPFTGGNDVESEIREAIRNSVIVSPASEITCLVF